MISLYAIAVDDKRVFLRQQDLREPCVRLRPALIKPSGKRRLPDGLRFLGKEIRLQD
jgi:hypothetical protein